MQKVLFVTNRNILTTSGELRLIKNRAEAIFDNYGIATDFIVLSNKERLQSDDKEIINAGGYCVAFEFSLINPLITLRSFIMVKNAIYERLYKESYGAVILSGMVMPVSLVQH